MLIEAELRHNPLVFTPHYCQVQRVVTLSAEAFAQYLKQPMAGHDFIVENEGWTYGEADGIACLLVLDERRGGGVLVGCEGSVLDCNAAFLPEAKLLLNAALEEAAELIIREAPENRSGADWFYYFNELREQTGVVVVPDNGIGPLLLKVLESRPEIVEVTMTYDHFEGVFSPEYCKTLSSADAVKQHSEKELTSSILNYLAEHDGSDELYQILHHDLGMTHEEIESLGFSLYHCYETEPSMSGPNL